MDFVAHSWASGGAYFIDAMATELHPFMVDFALSGGVRLRAQSAPYQRLSGRD
ncbi:hypothetical protein D3C73_1475540 [compost metagenome]